MFKSTLSQICCISLLLVSGVTQAQNSKWKHYDFKNEDRQHIHGVITSTQEIALFNRLPTSLEASVRQPVWALGKNSAGLYIDFSTDADSIQVNYQVAGPLAMPHMPNIGVSGVDLYAKDGRNWQWAYGSYSFKDTISYQFNSINKNAQSKQYRLYLPLYNTVKNMAISIPANRKITFSAEPGDPIIVYGTSIAQGACATRPGLAWTNILGRKLNAPMVNLGFSGNGRLEQPILDLIAQAKARIYILDCIPNLGSLKDYPDEVLDSLLENAVRTLRAKNAKTAIILTEHSSGENGGFLNYLKNEEYVRSSKVLQRCFNRLNNKYKNLYLLTNKDIGLDLESTVDYAHPNDIGMMKHAEAYERIINRIR